MKYYSELGSTLPTCHSFRRALGILGPSALLLSWRKHGTVLGNRFRNLARSSSSSSCFSCEMSCKRPLMNAIWTTLLPLSRSWPRALSDVSLMLTRPLMRQSADAWSTQIRKMMPKSLKVSRTPNLTSFNSSPTPKLSWHPSCNNFMR